MIQKSKKSVIAIGVLSAISLSPTVFASDLICTTANDSSASMNQIKNFSISARRSTGSSGNIPFRIYYSTNNTRGGHDVLLASTSVYSSGGNCSSMKQVSAAMTANSTGLGCFTPGQTGYYLFETANDLRSSPVSLSGSYPEITSVSPVAAQPGMPIRIYGSGFTNENTAVFFGNVQADRAILSDGEIYAIVPAGASSSTVEVRHYENGGQFCVPPLSTASFDVQPAACSSSASYTGYGNISSFANSYTSSACNNYTDNSTIVVENAAKGSGISIPFQLGTCGQPDYSKLLKFYVDWNQDSTFSESDELVISAPSVAANTGYALNVTVPSTATTGSVKARLITALYYSGLVDSTADVSACGNYPFGETMDFTIQVTQNSAGVMTAEIEDKEAFNNAIQALNNQTAQAKGTELTQQLPMLDSSITPLENAELPEQADMELSFSIHGPQERIVERRN